MKHTVSDTALCQGEEAACSPLQPSSVRVQHSESVVPPRIVELSSSRAVLSWRTGRGFCSFRTKEEVEETADDEEWTNLDKDISRGNTHDKIKKKTNRVRLLEVDHVELQICGCGCSQCIRGNRHFHAKGGPKTGYSCSYCFQVLGRLDCWRRVYQGHKRCCEVKLEPGNVLYHFRLLVRARSPPPERRGFLRTKPQRSTGECDSKRKMSRQSAVGTLRDRSSLEQIYCSPLRPAGTTNDRADSDNKTSAGVAVCSHDHSSRSPGNISDGEGASCGEMASIQEDTQPVTEDQTAHWFASASVFVDSRPPAITLHGIGTALVLTWPAVARFSGTERVLYILEQLSRPEGVTASTCSVICTTAGPRVENNEKSCARRRRLHSTRPKQVDEKKAFSVGQRCWFAPASLKTGRRYWYRLRIIHESGSSVGGPWVSYSTSLAPPACTDVDIHGLVLSFPRALGHWSVPPGNGKRVRSRGRKVTGADDPSALSRQRRPGPEEDGNTSYFDGDETEPLQEHDVRGGENGNLDSQPETAPVVWYTLQGLEAGPRWIVLYHGAHLGAIVKGLHANTINTFRVGIDVDMTELRRRALGSLALLELEPPPTHPNASSVDATAPIFARANSTTSLVSPTNPSYPGADVQSGTIRPAFRVWNAAARLPLSPWSSVSSKRRFWHPASSPFMLRMKQAGFTIYNVAATVVGGSFYPEPPSVPSPSQLEVRHGTVDEENANDDSDGHNRGRRRCRHYSELVTFATAPLAPRYAAFVVDGVQQVKLWWVAARPSTNDSEPLRAKKGTFAGKRLEPTKSEQSSAEEASPFGAINGTSNGSDMPLPQRHTSFTLEVFDPGAGGMRAVYSGPGLWTGLGRSPAQGFVSLAPAAAYSTRLSARITTAHPAGRADGVVITAPPAPTLEPADIGVGERSGAVTLKVFWTMEVDARFMPAGESLPSLSVALEMAHSWESVSPSHGTGGTGGQTFRAASGRVALATTRSIAEIGKTGEGGESRTQRIRTCSPGGDNIAVIKDSCGGECWTLGSSSLGKPENATGRFRVVWRGYDGETETLTPRLPPGMRFAFRVRVESRFGVAVSAATVYQTLNVVPSLPTGLRAYLTTHESRAGKKSTCVQLSWGLSDPCHGKNVITTFMVQARQVRRPRRHPGNRKPHDDHSLERHSWQSVCSCSDTHCLDPATLGVSKILADYRVRAQGPGGLGPWSDPLRVDIIDETPNKKDCHDGFKETPGGEFAEKSEHERPMGFVRPDTRPRDRLTGDVRRPWTLRRPLIMTPPSPAVSALMSPASEAAMASTMASAEWLHKRAGGSNQLLWGALASPRATYWCRTAAPRCKPDRLTPALGDLGASSVGDGEREGGEEGYDTGGIDRQGERTKELGLTIATDGSRADAAMPAELALVLRGQLDASSSFGFGQGSAELGTEEQHRGQTLDERGTFRGAGSGVEGDRLMQQNPGLPVVTWNASLQRPMEIGGGRWDRHHTTKSTKRMRHQASAPPRKKQQGASAPTHTRQRRPRHCGGDGTFRERKNIDDQLFRTTVWIYRQKYREKRPQRKYF